jgi:septum formation protein
VRLAPLGPAALASYLDSGEWRGKAGGYGIQDRACHFAELLAGDLDAVVGLPLALLRRLLARAGAAVGP